MPHLAKPLRGAAFQRAASMLVGWYSGLIIAFSAI
jgi:hypothetical protein